MFHGGRIFYFFLGILFISLFSLYLNLKNSAKYFSNASEPKYIDEYLIDELWDSKIRMSNLFSALSSNELLLFQKLRSIHKSCGQVCDTSLRGVQGKYYEQIYKKVDCVALFSNPNIDDASLFDEAPKEIPNYILPEFTHGGKLMVIDDFTDESSSVNNPFYWSKDEVEQLKEAFMNGTKDDLNIGIEQNVLDDMNEEISKIGVTGKTVLVIGSGKPWVESLLLAKGASQITSVDYVRIINEHPKIETLVTSELKKKYFAGEHYDLMVSYSSFQHSGLGRYGEMLNPWGDLIAMARAWCLVKQGGYGIVAVPAGPDIIGFNSQRVYGPLGFAQLFANWEVTNSNIDFSKYDGNECYFCYLPFHTLKRLYN